MTPEPEPHIPTMWERYQHVYRGMAAQMKEDPDAWNRAVSHLIVEIDRLTVENKTLTADNERLERAYSNVEDDVLNRMEYYAARNMVADWESIRLHHRELWVRDRERLSGR